VNKFAPPDRTGLTYGPSIADLKGDSDREMETIGYLMPIQTAAQHRIERRDSVVEGIANAPLADAPIISTKLSYNF
jgi:hypothetical protein